MRCLKRILVSKFLLVSGACLVLSASGCQKINELFLKPSKEDVIHKSYPINANAYKLSHVVHASPREFLDYFAGDLYWLEKASKKIQVGTDKMVPHTDMTKAGNSVDLSIKLLSLDLPFKLICLKHRPDEELWWMMVFTDDSWILLRFYLKPIPEGSTLNIDVLGQVSKYLASIADRLQLLEAVSLRADLIIALVQTEFDPKLDVDEVTSKGLRGELYGTFLQGYESSIRVDATPRQVTEWISSDKNNINNLIPNLAFKGECLENYRTLFTRPEETIYCPSTYRVGAQAVPAQVISKGGWEEADSFKSNSNIFWIMVLDTIMKVTVNVEKKGRGSELRFVTSAELPESQAPESMDLMMGLTQIPDLTEKILLNIKDKVEAQTLTYGSHKR